MYVDHPLRVENGWPPKYIQITQFVASMMSYVDVYCIHSNITPLYLFSSTKIRFLESIF